MFAFSEGILIIYMVVYFHNIVVVRERCILVHNYFFLYIFASVQLWYHNSSTKYVFLICLVSALNCAILCKNRRFMY